MCDKDSPPYLPNVYSLLANNSGNAVVAPLSASPPAGRPRIGATADELCSRLSAGGVDPSPDRSALNETTLSSLIHRISNHLRPKLSAVDDFNAKYDSLHTVDIASVKKRPEKIPSAHIVSIRSTNGGINDGNNSLAAESYSYKYDLNTAEPYSERSVHNQRYGIEEHVTAEVADESVESRFKSSHRNSLTVGEENEIAKPKPLIIAKLVADAQQPCDLHSTTNASAFLPLVKRKKKPYKELTLEEKVELIRLAERNSSLSQASIAERYAIAKSNVCRILQRRAEYLRAYESVGFAGSRKRKLRTDNCAPQSTTQKATNEDAKCLGAERLSSKANPSDDEQTAEHIIWQDINSEKASKLKTVSTENVNHTFIEPITVGDMRTAVAASACTSAQDFRSIDVLRAALLSISQQHKNNNNNSCLKGGALTSLSPAAADDATVNDSAAGATSPTRIAARPTTARLTTALADEPARQLDAERVYAANAILDFSLHSTRFERRGGWNDNDQLVDVVDVNNNAKCDKNQNSTDRKRDRTVIITDQNSDTASSSSSSSSSAFVSTFNSPIDLRNRHEDVYEGGRGAPAVARATLYRFQQMEQINSHLKSEVTQLREYTRKCHDEIEALRHRNEQLQYQLVSCREKAAIAVSHIMADGGCEFPRHEQFISEILQITSI